MSERRIVPDTGFSLVYANTNLNMSNDYSEANRRARKRMSQNYMFKEIMSSVFYEGSPVLPRVKSIYK